MLGHPCNLQYDEQVSLRVHSHGCAVTPAVRSEIIVNVNKFKKYYYAWCLWYDFGLRVAKSQTVHIGC